MGNAVGGAMKQDGYRLKGSVSVLFWKVFYCVACLKGVGQVLAILVI